LSSPTAKGRAPSRPPDSRGAGLNSEAAASPQREETETNLQLTKPLITGVVVLASSGALALATGALAARTVTLDKPCYVSASSKWGATIRVSGSGFTPGEAVFAQVSGRLGLVTFVEAKVGSEGGFSATLTKVLPARIGPVDEQVSLQIKGVVSEALLKSTPFWMTNLAVTTSPTVAPANKTVSFSFSGFNPGAPVYGHYLHNGHLMLTHRFGTTEGACGLLKARSAMYPGRSRYSSYTVQFDDQKFYSTSSYPKIDTQVAIKRF
jgi:hypothetical protein